MSRFNLVQLPAFAEQDKTVLVLESRKLSFAGQIDRLLLFYLSCYEVIALLVCHCSISSFFVKKILQYVTACRWLPQVSPTGRV